MVKKALALLWGLCLLLTVLAACGNRSEGVTPSAAATTPAVTPTPAGILDPIARGAWKDNVYSNEESGLKFKLPDGWQVASDKEIAALLDTASNTLGEQGEELVDTLMLTTVFDMMARKAGAGDTVSVLYVNMALFPGGSTMTEKDFLLVLQQLMAAVNIQDYEMEPPTTTELAGKDYVGVKTAEIKRGTTQHLFLRRQGDVMTVIVVSLSEDTEIADVLSHFS